MYTFDDFCLTSALYLCTAFIVMEKKGGFISRGKRDKWPHIDAHHSSRVCVARIPVVRGRSGPT